MKTCRYCGSSVQHVEQSNTFYCDFCDLVMQEENVQNDHKRYNQYIREFAFIEEMNKTTPELMTMPTFELLYLLKLIRQERSDCFNQIITFRKASELNKQNGIQEDQYQEVMKETGENYSFITKKAFVIENILCDRMGYVPEKITQLTITKYLENIRKSKQRVKPMKIRSQQKVS